MSPVVKIGGGLILVNFVYGIINLFILGQFLTLIPLTTFFIAIIFAVAFFVSVSKSNFSSLALLYMFCVFFLQSNSVFEIFLSQEKVAGFQGIFTPYFHVLEFLGVLLLWGLIFLPAVFKLNKNNGIKILSSILLILSIVVYFVFEGSFVTLISFLFLAITGFILRQFGTINEIIESTISSLILILTLVLMNTISLYISGLYFIFSTTFP